MGPTVGLTWVLLGPRQWACPIKILCYQCGVKHWYYIGSFMGRPMCAPLNTNEWQNSDFTWATPWANQCEAHVIPCGETVVIVRRAGLLWSQRDFEWRWSVPLFKCLTVLEFSFILFDLCLLITFFNFIMNYVPIVTFWIFTYHKIWILSIMFCFIWSYWIIYFLACLEVSWRVVS